MDLLNFSFDTIPGKSAFQSGSVEMHKVLFIAVVTEGCNEEVVYLHGIWDKCKDKLEDVNLVLLNDYYADDSVARSHSNPKNRYVALEEWRKEYAETYQMGNNDEEWLICDRDNGSFKSEQYDNLLEECRNRQNFHFVVSNPAFQIWLLFHYCSSIDGLNLDTIPKSKGRLKLVEKALKEAMQPLGYSHGALNFSHFSTHIKDAILNSTPYSYPLEELKEKSGTNFRDFLLMLEEKAQSQMF